MPTIGKVSLDGWGTATVPRAEKVARCSRVAVLIGEGRAGGRARLLPVGERGDRGDLFIAMLRSRLLAQNASLHRQANVTTVRRECQALVRPSEMRVCPSRRACPGRMEELSRLCSRKRDRPSLSADPNRASASRRRFQHLWMTVEMWTRLRTLYFRPVSCHVEAGADTLSGRCCWMRTLATMIVPHGLCRTPVGARRREGWDLAERAGEEGVT